MLSKSSVSSTSRLVLQTYPSSLIGTESTDPDVLPLGLQITQKSLYTQYDNISDHFIPVSINGVSAVYFITSSTPHFNCAHIARSVTTFVGDGLKLPLGYQAIRPPTHTRLNRLVVRSYNDTSLRERAGIMSLRFIPFRHKNDASEIITDYVHRRAIDLVRSDDARLSRTSEVEVRFTPDVSNGFCYGFHPPNDLLGVILFTCDLDDRNQVAIPSGESFSFKFEITMDFSHYSIGPRRLIYCYDPLRDLIPKATIYYQPRLRVVESSRMHYGLDCINLDDLTLKHVKAGERPQDRDLPSKISSLHAMGTQLTFRTRSEAERQISVAMKRVFVPLSEQVFDITPDTRTTFSKPG